MKPITPSKTPQTPTPSLQAQRVVIFYRVQGCEDRASGFGIVGSDIPGAEKAVRKHMSPLLGSLLCLYFSVLYLVLLYDPLVVRINLCIVAPIQIVCVPPITKKIPDSLNPNPYGL